MNDSSLLSREDELTSLHESIDDELGRQYFGEYGPLWYAKVDEYDTLLDVCSSDDLPSGQFPQEVCEEFYEAQFGENYDVRLLTVIDKYPEVKKLMEERAVNYVAQMCWKEFRNA